MSHAIPWILGLSIGLLASTVAQADLRTFSTPRDTPVVLSQPHNWDADCTLGTAKVRIIDPPANGTITVHMARYSLGDFGYPGSTVIGTLPEACRNRTVLGPQVVYTPDAGFTGTDTTVLRFTFSLIEGGESKYKIEIE
jgi:hypothetical protein